MVRAFMLQGGTNAPLTQEGQETRSCSSYGYPVENVTSSEDVRCKRSSSEQKKHDVWYASFSGLESFLKIISQAQLSRSLFAFFPQRTTPSVGSTEDWFVQHPGKTQHLSSACNTSALVKKPSSLLGLRWRKPLKPPKAPKLCRVCLASRLGSALEEEMVCFIQRVVLDVRGCVSDEKELRSFAARLSASGDRGGAKKAKRGWRGKGGGSKNQSVIGGK